MTPVPLILLGSLWLPPNDQMLAVVENVIVHWHFWLKVF
jgi:hypothetical protein